MSETAELAAALAAAQAELPEVKKNRNADVKNKEGKYLYSYSYADLADVSAAVLPVLGKHGLAFAAFPGHQPDGKFGLRYFLLHSAGGSIEGFFEIDDKGGMQLVGGRITYARRYCLCAVTGATADEDVDARDDSRSPTVRRQQPPGGNGARQPQQAVQRRPQSSPPAQAAPPSAAATPRADAGGDLPPLPGEEDAPGPADPAPPEARPGAPGASDAPGTVTTAQLTAIWTVLSQVYHFGPDEKDAARGVCAQILGYHRGEKVELKTSTLLSKRQAGTVIDTLAMWQEQAKAHDEDPRGYLMLMLQTAGDPRDEEGAPGGE